jgi:hypothetical protein
MTRVSGSGRSRPGGLGYFIRRCGDECDVIELRPDDREVIIASGLAPRDAEDLCARKIEALRQATPALPLTDPRPASAEPKRKKHGGRQLAFKFE